MSEKKTLMLYQDYKQYFEMLSGEEAKTLLLALFDYNVNIEPEPIEGMGKMAFAFMSNQMDRDNEKYQATVQARKEAGRKGGLTTQANANKDKQIEASSSKIKQVQAKPSDTVTDTDTVTDINIKDKNIVQIASDCEPSLGLASTCETDPAKDKDASAKRDEQRHKDKEAEKLFEFLWQQYPVKRGKGNVSKTQKLSLARIGKEEMVRAIERYKSDVANASFDLSFKNGSTFFNSGYIDYLDANYEARPMLLKRGKVPSNHLASRSVEEHESRAAVLATMEE